jgi:hypothetical protein
LNIWLQPYFVAAKKCDICDKTSKHDFIEAFK